MSLVDLRTTRFARQRKYFPELTFADADQRHKAKRRVVGNEVSVASSEEERAALRAARVEGQRHAAQVGRARGGAVVLARGTCSRIEGAPKMRRQVFGSRTSI